MFQCKTLLTATLICLSGIANATAVTGMSSNITFPEMVAQPGNDVQIDLSKLYSHVTYSLICTLSDNTNSESISNDVRISLFNKWFDNTTLQIDSKDAKFSKAQSYQASGSQFVIQHIVKENTYVVIQNLDTTDNLLVNHCVAMVEHD